MALRLRFSLRRAHLPATLGCPAGGFLRLITPVGGTGLPEVNVPSSVVGGSFVVNEVAYVWSWTPLLRKSVVRVKRITPV